MNSFNLTVFNLFKYYKNLARRDKVYVEHIPEKLIMGVQMRGEEGTKEVPKAEPTV